MVSPETHPLRVDLVLERLFEYLPEKDLKSCRLVCTQWFFPATKALQRVGRPIIFGCLYKVNLIRFRPDLDTILTFTNVMTESKRQDIRRELPFVKFDIRPYMFAPQFIHLFNKFIVNFGTAVHSLCIRLAFESADDFSDDCCPVKLYNLKSLEFCNSLHGELRPALTTSLYTLRKHFLQSLLQAAPVLESLYLWCDRENIIWPLDVALVLAKVKLRNLRNLKMSLPLSNDCLASLCHMNAQLNTLVFVLREPAFDPKLFSQFLHSQRHTLRSLRLIDLQCNNQKVIELPLLPRLESLEIEGTFYGDESSMTFENFTYGKVPALKRISLTSCNRRNFDLNAILYTCINKATICDSVEEFQFSLDQNSSDLGGNCIRRLRQVYPNLTKLSVIFTAESKWVLTTVFEQLTRLRELCINVRKCVDNLDCVLTGIPPNLYEHLTKVGMYRHHPISLDPRQLSPSIVNLQDLKYLEIVGEAGIKAERHIQFTDFTVYMALLRMKALKCLVFKQAGYHLSVDVLAKLASSLDFIHQF